MLYAKLLLKKKKKEAAEEEKKLAVAKNSYHDGVPAISVIVDAGWSKRSHKHSYNASQGSALSLGLRQKSCYMLVSEISFVAYVEELKVRAKSLSR